MENGDDFVSRAAEIGTKRSLEEERRRNDQDAAAALVGEVTKRLPRLVDAFRAAGVAPKRFKTGRVYQRSPGGGWWLGWRTGTKPFGPTFELWVCENGDFYLRKINSINKSTSAAGIQRLEEPDITSEFLRVTDIQLIPGNPVHCQPPNTIDGGYYQPIPLDDFLASFVTSGRGSTTP